jgi:hypothetical protein
MVCTELIFIECRYLDNKQTFLAELVRVLIWTSDGPPLELVSHPVVMVQGLPPGHSSKLYKDAKEERAINGGCMFLTHFDKLI